MVAKEFHHQDAIEHHWMNVINDYDVRIRDYYGMTLYLAESTLNLNILVEIRQRDSKELLDPLFNLDKIRERPIMNAKVDREEGDDINHRERHVVKMMKEWIKQPFQLDSIPDTIIFHAQARLEKGRERKITILLLRSSLPSDQR